MPMDREVVVEMPSHLARKFNSIRVRGAVITDGFLKLQTPTTAQVIRVREQVGAMMKELHEIDLVLYAMDCELMEKEQRGDTWKTTKSQA